MSAETVTVTAGSAAVTGSNTHFSTECAAGGYLKFIDDLGVYHALMIKSIESDTALTLFNVAPAASTATAYPDWRYDAMKDTWMIPGKNGTGEITVVSGNKTVNGTNTNFNPEEAAGTHVYYFDEDGVLQNNTVTLVDSDTVCHFNGFPPSNSDGATAFVYAAAGSSIGSQVTGEDGEIYTPNANFSMPMFAPGPSVAAFVANGWHPVLPSTGFQPPAPPEPPTPQVSQTMLPPTNDATPYDVTGDDGHEYHLQPWSDAGTYNLFVPGPAVNAALAAGWTI